MSVLALSASLSSKYAVAASRNRVNLSGAEWLAGGCLARARSHLAAALAEEAEHATLSPPSAWLRVAEIVSAPHTTAAAGCTVSARAVGSRLDVNSADEITLSGLFRYAGVTPARADSIAAAIADWKDPDDIARPFGAERSWYDSVGAVPPSNSPFTHVGQLMMVRGMPDAPTLDSLLDVERGGISINHAPAAVLAQLPGFTPEAISQVLNSRAEGRFVRAFAELREGLSPSARAAMEAAEPDLVARASLTPRRWILTARAQSGVPPVEAIIELEIERLGAGILVMRRRSWSR